MEEFVTDTMGLILYLEKRKPTKAKSLFQKASHEEIHIHIPSMVIAEIGYLSEKGKIELSLSKVEQFLASSTNYSVYPQVKENK